MSTGFSLKGSLKHEFAGEQTKEELVNYAMRMSGPSVLLVTKPHTVNEIKENNPIFFGYVGQQTGNLWVNNFIFLFIQYIFF